MERWVYIDHHFVEKEQATLHVRDLAIQRGYGIFEFFKVSDHQPVFLDDHLDRFFYSAGQMFLPVPYARTQLKQIIQELIAKNALASGGIRITLTGGYSADGYQLSDPNLILWAIRFQQPASVQYQNGIKLLSVEYQRQFPSVKTIDYLMAIHFQRQLRKEGADDALYHHKGLITESPRSNFFLVTEEGRLATPSRNILKGVTRKKLLELAAPLFEVEERDISMEELSSAKEAFITSTTKMVMPVRQIDGYKFAVPFTVAGKLTGLLMKLQSI